MEESNVVTRSFGNQNSGLAYHSGIVQTLVVDDKSRYRKSKWKVQ